MNSDQVLIELKRVGTAITSMFNRVGDCEYDIEYARTAEDLMREEELRKVFEKLDECNQVLSYLAKPVVFTGKLKKNKNGRYEVTGFGREFTCGDRIEVLIYDEYYEHEKWVISRVEHDLKDYYIVGYNNINMQGLTIRFR